MLAKYGVEMIGASLEVIHKAEDREKFRHAIEKIGLRMPKSGFARNMNDVLKIADDNRLSDYRPRFLYAGRHRQRRGIQPRGT